jgi:hypothetical protein
MKSTALLHAGRALVGRPERVDAGEADADEDRVEAARQVVEQDLFAERLPALQLDAADRQQPVDLLLREAVDRLVGRETVFVQPAGFGLASNTVTSWPSSAARCAHDRPAGPAPTTAMRRPVGAARWNSGARACEIVVGRMALQQADLDRLVLVRVAHAGLLAQHLGRADARAHAAEHVRLEDRARRAARVVLADPADERRDVDARSGRPGCRARRGSSSSARPRSAPGRGSAADGRRRSCRRTGRPSGGRRWMSGFGHRAQRP